MSDWSDRAKQLKQLAFIDESEPYEVDQAGVFKDEFTGRYVLLTATGCSCWDGDFDEEEFDSLDALQEGLTNRQRQYNPSLEGVKQLMEEARRTEES